MFAHPSMTVEERTELLAALSKVRNLALGEILSHPNDLQVQGEIASALALAAYVSGTSRPVADAVAELLSTHRGITLAAKARAQEEDGRFLGRLASGLDAFLLPEGQSRQTTNPSSAE